MARPPPPSCGNMRRFIRDPYRRPRLIRTDEQGALEGLPLYLIILITITAITLVVIIALIPRPLIPNFVSVDVTDGPGATPNVLCWGSTAQNVKVSVFTRDNVAINDATVHIVGAGLDVTQRTANGGMTTLTGPITNTSNPQPPSTTRNLQATFRGGTNTAPNPVEPGRARGRPA